MQPDETDGFCTTNGFVFHTSVSTTVFFLSQLKQSYSFILDIVVPFMQVLVSRSY